MKFYMYPFAYRRYTKMCKRIVIFAIVYLLLVLPPIGLIPEGLDVKATTTLALCLALPFVFIYAILWHRSSTFATTVSFEKDRIRVVTKGGKCKREILYASVTGLEV